MRATGKPLMLSTGMSEMDEIEEAVATVGMPQLLLAHSTSSYPCRVEDLNLRMIGTLKQRFPQTPIGYSGHEVGLAPTWAAVTMGAASSNVTSLWTAPCGAATRRPRWRCWACTS